MFETSIRNVRAGNHKITWEGSDMSGAVVPSGLYLYQISTDTRSVIGKDHNKSETIFFLI